MREERNELPIDISEVRPDQEAMEPAVHQSDIRVSNTGGRVIYGIVNMLLAVGSIQLGFESHKPLPAILGLGATAIGAYHSSVILHIACPDIVITISTRVAIGCIPSVDRAICGTLTVRSLLEYVISN
jgi:hypothetical protein